MLLTQLELLLLLSGRFAVTRTKFQGAIGVHRVIEMKSSDLTTHEADNETRKYTTYHYLPKYGGKGVCPLLS